MFQKYHSKIKEGSLHLFVKPKRRNYHEKNYFHFVRSRDKHGSKCLQHLQRFWQGCGTWRRKGTGRRNRRTKEIIRPHDNLKKSVIFTLFSLLRWDILLEL